MSKIYVISTPNAGYTGKTFGIRFENGKAVVSKESFPSELGYTLEYALRKLREDFGYIVAEASATAAEPVVIEESPKKRGRKKRVEGEQDGVSRIQETDEEVEPEGGS